MYLNQNKQTRKEIQMCMFKVSMFVSNQTFNFKHFPVMMVVGSNESKI